MNDPNEWHHCSTCRKSIPFGARYYRCSVSTCNRPRLALYFCSVGCWDAHVPTLRHRDAWAEEAVAPSRQDWEREQEADRNVQESPVTPSEAARGRVVSQEMPKHRVVDAKPALPTGEQEILIVVSKLKQYVRTRSGMNTSDAVAAVLSDHVRALCDDAIERASREGRKTVLDRDVPSPTMRVSRST